MIRTLFNSPHVLWQDGCLDLDRQCQSLGISVDANGIISIRQEESEIVLNKETIPELCKLLKKLAE